MKIFTLCEDNLVWDFLEELEISSDSIFEQELKKLFPDLRDNEINEIMDHQSDAIHEEVSDIFGDIVGYADEEFEEEEASGLWGYYVFEISDMDNTVKYFENLISEKMKTLILKLVKGKKIKLK